MERVLDVYKRPYEPDYPVICMDESPKQLLGVSRQEQTTTFNLKSEKEIRTIKISYDRIEIGNMLTAWINIYQALIFSSEKITDVDSNKNIEIFEVRLMLRGMALESLLKTLAISRKIKLISSDGSLHKDYRKISHNLCSLAIKLEVILTDDETKMLNILSDAIETGRYPVPAKSTQIKRFWIVPTYENIFSKFIEKAENLINIETANA